MSSVGKHHKVVKSYKKKMKKLIFPILVGIVVTDIAIGAEGRGFDFRADLIGHTTANASPPLRYFFAAVLPRR